MGSMYLSYTDADPWTVMIEVGHTIVADSTVGAARRSIQLARGAPARPDIEAIDGVNSLHLTATTRRLINFN